MCADKVTKRAYHLKHCAPVSAAALCCTEGGGRWWREARVLLSEGPAPGVGRGTLSNEKRDHVSDRGSPCGPPNEGKPQVTGNEPAAPAAPSREGLHSWGTEHVVHRALVMPPERTRMQDTVLVATQLCDPASPTVRLLNVGQKDTVIPKGAVVAELVLRHLDDDAHTRLADVLQGTLEKNSGVVEKAADQTGTAGSYPYTPHLVKLSPRSELPESEPLPADLQAVVDRCEGIGAREKERVAALVREYSDCFSLNGEMGNCDWVYFEIDTQGHAPVREARADDSGAGASGEKDAGVCAVELRPAPGYDPSGWMRAQHADPDVCPILVAVQAGAKPSLEQAARMSERHHACPILAERYDRKARVTPFEAGDKVWFYNPIRKRGINPKLQRSWESGWKIAEVINDITMRIQREKRRPRVVHVDRLAKAAETRDGQPVLRNLMYNKKEKKEEAGTADLGQQAAEQAQQYQPQHNEHQLQLHHGQHHQLQLAQQEQHDFREWRSLGLSAEQRSEEEADGLPGVFRSAMTAL
ncbi:Xaa-Pro dipeptidase [Frankliniella fusca]|uniref:Xaa-Pro dipeptidase n=1 Tax=Frankliniella fusca TaxID=407009 RepID=A0AAE1HWQ8_9NEOP|nr:Xaa-Pro dipeptidase [Frankliniella fusca]